MNKGPRLILVSCLIILSFLFGHPNPVRAKFPTILELKTSPDPAWIKDTVLIECRLFAKGASGTTQRAKGGILSITIYSLAPRVQVNQFVDKPNGQYDLFEFSWNPPSPGRYKIEAGYSGSNFLSAVRTSKVITVTQNRPRAQTTAPSPTSTSIRVFVPSTTVPVTTTTLRPATTRPPLTTTTTAYVPPRHQYGLPGPGHHPAARNHLAAARNHHLDSSQHPPRPAPGNRPAGDHHRTGTRCGVGPASLRLGGDRRAGSFP